MHQTSVMHYATTNSLNFVLTFISIQILHNRSVSSFSPRVIGISHVIRPCACTTVSNLAMANGEDNTIDMYTDQNNADSINFYNIRAVIFDIDGTLADSWQLGYDATSVVLQNNSIDPITPEIYHQCTRYCTPERLARHAGYEPGDDEFDSIGEKLAQEFDSLYIGLVSATTARFFPGVHSLLNSIPANVTLGAFTNAAVDYAHAVLEANIGSSHRFESVRGADDVPAPKPHPDGLLTVCKDININPHDCVYIGDSPTDAMAASAAGMPSIGVTWGSHNVKALEQAPFTVLCDSVESLARILPSR